MHLLTLTRPRNLPWHGGLVDPDRSRCFVARGSPKRCGISAVIL